MSFHAALTAFFWASLVRVALLHHVTWSINSICHTFGNEDFVVRDKSRQRRLAGHSRPSASPGTTCTTPTRPAPGPARLRGQLDPSARVIWAFEKLGWACDVRWPDEERLATKRPAGAKAGAWLHDQGRHGSAGHVQERRAAR